MAGLQRRRLGELAEEAAGAAAAAEQPVSGAQGQGPRTGEQTLGFGDGSRRVEGYGVEADD